MLWVDAFALLKQNAPNIGKSTCILITRNPSHVTLTKHNKQVTIRGSPIQPCEAGKPTRNGWYVYKINFDTCF